MWWISRGKRLFFFIMENDSTWDIHWRHILMMPHVGSSVLERTQQKRKKNYVRWMNAQSFVFFHSFTRSQPDIPSFILLFLSSWHSNVTVLTSVVVVASRKRLHQAIVIFSFKHTLRFRVNTNDLQEEENVCMWIRRSEKLSNCRKVALDSRYYDTIFRHPL